MPCACRQKYKNALSPYAKQVNHVMPNLTASWRHLQVPALLQRLYLGCFVSEILIFLNSGGWKFCAIFQADSRGKVNCFQKPFWNSSFIELHFYMDSIFTLGLKEPCCFVAELPSVYCFSTSKLTRGWFLYLLHYWQPVFVSVQQHSGLLFSVPSTLNIPMLRLPSWESCGDKWGTFNAQSKAPLM